MDIGLPFELLFELFDTHVFEARNCGAHKTELLVCCLSDHGLFIWLYHVVLVLNSFVWLFLALQIVVWISLVLIARAVGARPCTVRVVLLMY